MIIGSVKLAAMKHIAKKRVRESTPLSSTKACHAVNYLSYSPHLTWFKGKKAISNTLDECTVGSWIFAKSQINVCIICRFQEHILILLRIANDYCLSHSWHPCEHSNRFSAAYSGCVSCVGGSLSDIQHALSCETPRWGGDSDNPSSSKHLFIQSQHHLTSLGRMHCLFSMFSTIVIIPSVLRWDNALKSRNGKMWG